MFTTYPCRLVNGNGLFCSRTCKIEATIERTERPLTHERLIEALIYDPASGLFTWRVKPKHRPIQVGDRAGSVGSKGYRFVCLDNQDYAEHRLAYFYMMKDWPPDQIDHKDLNKANNKWDNIRPADGNQNQANRRLTILNTTGFKGVTGRQFAKSYKYIAQISHQGTNTHLGVFETAEAAHEAYCQEASRLHGEFFNKG